MRRAGYSPGVGSRPLDPGGRTGPAIRVGARWLPIHRARTAVGRRSRDGTVVPDIDLSLLDAGRRVSRRHAQLTWEDGEVHLADLGSANGTSVNDRPVPPAAAVRLQDGDRISFAGVEAWFGHEVPWPEGVVAEWDESCPPWRPDDYEPTVVGPRPRLPDPPAPPARRWWSRLADLPRAVLRRRRTP